MKNTVFARPNLKVLLLGAILIAVVQNFIANGNSQGTLLHARSPSRSDAASRIDLQQLLAAAEETPNSQLYVSISNCFEKRGDMRRAMIYLRKAQLLAQLEEADE
jgi:hypothetical protein